MVKLNFYFFYKLQNFVEASLLAMILLFIHEYFKDEYQNIEVHADAINTIFPKTLLVHYSFFFFITIYPYIKSHALR